MPEPITRIQYRKNLQINSVFRRGVKKNLHNNNIQHVENVKHRNAWNPLFLDGFSLRHLRDFMLALCLCTILMGRYSSELRRISFFSKVNGCQFSW